MCLAGHAKQDWQKRGWPIDTLPEPAVPLINDASPFHSLIAFCVTPDSSPLLGLNLLPFDPRDLHSERKGRLRDDHRSGPHWWRARWPNCGQRGADQPNPRRDVAQGPATRSVDNTINGSILSKQRGLQPCLQAT